MMDWEGVEGTLGKAFRKNGRELVDARAALTPLSDLLSKEKLPDLAEMTLEQLRECAVKQAVSVPRGTGREEMIEMIEGENAARWDERIRGWKACLQYIFVDGPHPLALNRRAYALAKALEPSLIFDMSLADLAVLCGDGNGPRETDGRATVSARVKRIYEAPLKKAGMKGFKAPYQKGASTSPGYSEAATGNQNRRGREFLELQNGEFGNQKNGRKAA